MTPLIFNHKIEDIPSRSFTHRWERMFGELTSDVRDILYGYAFTFDSRIFGSRDVTLDTRVGTSDSRLWRCRLMTPFYPTGDDGINATDKFIEQAMLPYRKNVYDLRNLVLIDDVNGIVSFNKNAITMIKYLLKQLRGELCVAYGEYLKNRQYTGFITEEICDIYERIAKPLDPDIASAILAYVKKVSPEIKSTVMLLVNGPDSVEIKLPNDFRAQSELVRNLRHRMFANYKVDSVRAMHNSIAVDMRLDMTAHV